MSLKTQHAGLASFPMGPATTSRQAFLNRRESE
jgi:hypothetical protein